MKTNSIRSIKALLFVFFITICFSVTAQGTRTHVINQGETLYRLTQIYNVSAEEICAANPGLSATHFPVGLPVTIPTHNGNTVLTQSSVAAKNAVRVALVLPFGLEERVPESARMLEFYQGFLMAVDTLKKQGVSIDLRVYDTGKEGASIRHILEDESLKKADLLIGGYHWGDIKQLSDYCKKNRIKMVLPFSSNDHFVANNPEIFMINTPQRYLYPVVQELFKLYFADAAVFFLESKEKKEDKRGFVDAFKRDLTTQKIAYETIAPGESAAEITKKLKKKKENIFIPVSGDNKVLEEWMPTLTTLLETNADKKIRLFGYPEWQTYTGRYISRFHNLDTYIYTTFYSSEIFPSARKFKANFKKWFRKDPPATFPKFSMLGYDLGLYFVTAISRYGTNFTTASAASLNAIPTLQNGFRFERINSEGGFINKNIYFINFSKSMEIAKTELQE